VFWGGQSHLIAWNIVVSLLCFYYERLLHLRLEFRRPKLSHLAYRRWLDREDDHYEESDGQKHILVVYPQGVSPY
jgi:hypothetical protein